MPLLEQVLEQYPEKVKIVFKNYPLRSHSYATKAANAALAAGTFGKFWEFHDRLFQNYNQLNDQKVDQITRELGLDPAVMKERQQRPEVQKILRQDLRDAANAEVRATPSVFINGRILKRRSLNEFTKAIDAELRRITTEH